MSQVWTEVCIVAGVRIGNVYLRVYLWLLRVSVGACGLSLAAVSGGSSLVPALGLLIAVASLVAEHSLWSMWASVVAPRHVGSSQSRAPTCVLSLDRWILNHWITREVQNRYLPLSHCTSYGRFLKFCISFLNSELGQMIKLTNWVS